MLHGMHANVWYADLEYETYLTTTAVTIRQFQCGNITDSPLPASWVDAAHSLRTEMYAVRWPTSRLLPFAHINLSRVCCIYRNYTDAIVMPLVLGSIHD
jgi:hypothetical protein